MKMKIKGLAEVHEENSHDSLPLSVLTAIFQVNLG